MITFARGWTPWGCPCNVKLVDGVPEGSLQEERTMSGVESGAVCPFCGERVDEAGVSYGGELMHKRCFQVFGQEMEVLGAETSEVHSVVVLATVG